MSSLKSAIAVLELEPNSITAEARKPAGPVLVNRSGKRPDDHITRLVEAALDADFTNGSMPA